MFSVEIDSNFAKVQALQRLAPELEGLWTLEQEYQKIQTPRE